MARNHPPPPPSEVQWSAPTSFPGLFLSRQGREKPWERGWVGPLFRRAKAKAVNFTEQKHQRESYKRLAVK